MVSFRRMLPSDALAVCLQDQQARLSELVQRADYREMLVRDGHCAWTCHSGAEIHGCGGIVRQWDAPHLGRAWALVGTAVPREAWFAITEFVRDTLDDALAAMPAIETEVDIAHRAGHRWAHLIGFRLAGVRPYRNAATALPAAYYTFTGGYDGVPVSVSAALDFLDRVTASWLTHAPGTAASVIMKGALTPPAAGRYRPRVSLPAPPSELREVEVLEPRPRREEDA